MIAGIALSAATALVVFVATWAVGRRIGRFNVVDITWGLAFVTIAAVTLAWARNRCDVATARQWLILALVTVWGLRLAGYIGWRSRGHGEDPRYERMLSRASGSRDMYALTRVFLLQAVIAWFVALPVQVGMFERSSLNVLAIAGTVLWVVGFFFEAVGDAQLAAFKRDPGNKGHVMDRGLWRYTRHPNYFGEACMWTGIYLIAAQQWQGAVTVLSPIAITYFVAFKTGKPMLERMMSQSKIGYDDYVRRTSGFFPLPPRPPEGHG